MTKSNRNPLGFLIYRDNGGDTPDKPSAFSMGERQPPRVPKGMMDKKPDLTGVELPGEVDVSLESNAERMSRLFNMPTNGDVIRRDLFIEGNPSMKAAIFYIEGLAQSAQVNQFILEPLMVTGNLVPEDNLLPERRILNRLVTSNQVMLKTAWKDLMPMFLMGMGLMFVDGIPKGFLIECKGWEHRTVGTPLTEQVVRGPQEGFTEHIRVNTALVRRRIRSPRLVMEHVPVGRLSQTTVVISYIEGIANTRLIKEVRRRIKGIDVDYLPDSGYLEQYVEDRPNSVFPQTLTTERPDRVSAYLSEGNIALLVDGSPFVIIVPAIFTTFFQTPEDYYLRWPFGFTLRLIRLVALFLALYLPGLWISIMAFHPEMVPTPLLYAIQGTRQNLPFTMLIELLVMELAFELIREAGVRIPSMIGSTLGIVGALILGQAAVAASIVSPVLIIIIAVTGLASFAVPSFSASFTLRLLRFPISILGGTLGFFGVATGTFIIVTYLVSLSSFGVPYMSTIAPARKSRDTSFLGHLFQMDERPGYLHPSNKGRQADTVRKWDRPDKPESDGKNGGGGDGE